MDQMCRINNLENLIERFLDGRDSKEEFKKVYNLYWEIVYNKK